MFRRVVIGQQSTNHRELSSSANQKELYEWLLIVIKYPEDFIECRKELHQHCCTFSGHQIEYFKGFCVCFLFSFFFHIPVFQGFFFFFHIPVFQQTFGSYKSFMWPNTVIAWCLIWHIVCCLGNLVWDFCRLYWALYYVEERWIFGDSDLGLTIYTFHYELVYYIL